MDILLDVTSSVTIFLSPIQMDPEVITRIKKNKEKAEQLLKLKLTHSTQNNILVRKKEERDTQVSLNISIISNCEFEILPLYYKLEIFYSHNAKYGIFESLNCRD
jgi:hypothetical protein